jgi:hypothetical protein
MKLTADISSAIKSGQIQKLPTASAKLRLFPRLTCLRANPEHSELRLMRFHAADPVRNGLVIRIARRGELPPAAVKLVTPAVERERMLQQTAGSRIARNYQSRRDLEVLARLLFSPRFRAFRHRLEPEGGIRIDMASDAARMPRSFLKKNRLDTGLVNLEVERLRRRKRSSKNQQPCPNHGLQYNRGHVDLGAPIATRRTGIGDSSTLESTLKA